VCFTPKKSVGGPGKIDDVDVMVDPADLELDPSSQAVVQQNKVAAPNMAVFQEWAAGLPSDASKRISFHDHRW
jgi:ferredoxin/flavodoxin---NADP+ reductase